jgi:nicotinamidase/pyrazinamidase
LLGCILLTAIAVIVTGLVYIASPTRGPSIGQYPNPRKAVLVIDVQEDFTTMAGKRSFPPDAVERMIAIINRITAQARDRGIPVISIRQEFDNLLTIWLVKIGAGGFGIKGRLGTRLDPRIHIIPGSVDFTKPKGDAFSNPKLDAWLRAQHVAELYLMGLDGVACVNRSAQGAINRGYRVNFIMDGIITQYKGRWNKLVSIRMKEGVGVITADRFPS